MSQSDGASKVPPGPAPVKVPLPGVPPRLGALIVFGIVALIVGISILGRSGADPSEPPASPAALAGSTATAAPGRAPSSTAMAEPTPAPTEPWRRRGAPAATGGTPLPDFSKALPGDEAGDPLPLGRITGVPNPDRLDFLFDLGDFRDAHWLDPENPAMGSGVWTAGRPFHVREGFINEGEEPLGDGFDVVLYVTRLDSGRAEPTYRYTSDYVLRGTSDRCGPTYWTQTRPAACEWFVHDFPEGLPEGRWAIWAMWEAPCRAWIDLGLADACRDPDQVLSLFSSGFDAPYGRSGPDYSEPAR